MEHEEYIGHVRQALKEKIIIDENDCWIWQGQVDRKGYGRRTFTENKKKRKLLAHRISYKIFVGEIPDGLFILHQCDVPRCINPQHLHLGTQKDNLNEMRERDRANDISKGKKGDRHNLAKLSETDVKEIRRLREKGYTGVKLSEMFNVTNGLIYMIINKRIWKHI